MLITTAAIAEPLRLESGVAQVSVLELFTSEGCSSCPPADRWLSGLKDNEGLWRDFVPLAFHVDYWDYLGWQDRFASGEHSQRQRRYERQDAVRTVYTPGFVLNGREWRGWFGRRSANFTSGASPGVLRAVVAGDEIKVALRPTAEPQHRLRATVALLGNGLQTQVKAGENRGRSLLHDFVVLGLYGQPLQRVKDLHTAVLKLPSRSVEAQRYAVAIWISGYEQQAPIQAVGGWLD